MYGKQEFHEYMQAQIKEILKYKVELEKVLGYKISRNRAAMEWIQQHSKEFEEKWRAHVKRGV